MFSLEVDYGFQGKNSIKYENVKMQFEYGDIINILGENGCGKSTFFKLLMGEILPMKGNIDDRIIENSVVVSDYVGLPDECLVADLLKLLGEDKVSYMQESFPELFRIVVDMNDKKISVMSTGQKRILEIFCALSTKRQILILDEANSGLDIYNRQLLINQVKKLSQCEKIVIFNTTHYMEDVIDLGGRIYIMNKHDYTISEYKGDCSVEKIMECLKGVLKHE